MILNTETMSLAAYDKLAALDATFVGTADYMGVAWFWNHKYRHSLRDATPHARCLIHAKFLRAGLAPDGDSPAHDAIINKQFGYAV